MRLLVFAALAFTLVYPAYATVNPVIKDQKITVIIDGECAPQVIYAIVDSNPAKLVKIPYLKENIKIIEEFILVADRTFSLVGNCS